MTKTFCRSGKDSDLLKHLAEKASFYGHQQILELLKPQSKDLPLEAMMQHAITSDCSEAVEVVSDMMRENGVHVTQEMIQTAQKRRVTKIIETITKVPYDVDHEKENTRLDILNGDDKTILGKSLE